MDRILGNKEYLRVLSSGIFETKCNTVFFDIFLLFHTNVFFSIQKSGEFPFDAVWKTGRSILLLPCSCVTVGLTILSPNSSLFLHHFGFWLARRPHSRPIVRLCCDQWTEISDRGAKEKTRKFFANGTLHACDQLICMHMRAVRRFRKRLYILIWSRRSMGVSVVVERYDLLFMMGGVSIWKTRAFKVAGKNCQSQRIFTLPIIVHILFP